MDMQWTGTGGGYGEDGGGRGYNPGFNPAYEPGIRGRGRGLHPRGRGRGSHGGGFGGRGNYNHNAYGYNFSYSGEGRGGGRPPRPGYGGGRGTSGWKNYGRPRRQHPAVNNLAEGRGPPAHHNVGGQTFRPAFQGRGLTEVGQGAATSHQGVDPHTSFSNTQGGPALQTSQPVLITGTEGQEGKPSMGPEPALHKTRTEAKASATATTITATKATSAHAALEVPRDTVSPNSELAVMNNEVPESSNKGSQKSKGKKSFLLSLSYKRSYHACLQCDFML